MHLNLRGITLTGLVIGLALAAVVAVLAARSLDGMGRSFNQAKVSSDRDELAGTLRTLLDCTATKPAVPAGCAAGTPIALFKRGGAALVQIPVGNTFTRFGEWRVRASCTDTPGLYNVETAEFQNRNCKPGETGPCWEPLFKIPRGCP